MIPSENKFSLGKFDKNIDMLPKVVSSIVKKYNNYCTFVAPNDGNIGNEAKSLVKKLLIELNQVRVAFEIMVFYYSNKSPRVCYLLGTNHPFQDVAKRMEKMDKTKIFNIDEVKNILKLSEAKGKKETNQFDDWEGFFKIYCQWYPRETIKAKYTINNKNNIKNYVFIETK